MNLTDTIKIQVSTAAKRTWDDVPAKIYGPLALHKDIVQGKRQLWRITHIRTGLRVLGELSLKDATAIIKDLRSLPEWEEPTLGDGRTAENGEVFDRLYFKVRQARHTHLEGGL